MYSLLIVDDEPLTREYMRLNVPLIHSGWTVAGEAEDGAGALEFLEEKKVDLVITDIKMPVMDGLELCRRISQKHPGLKIVILSGYDDFAYAREALLYGVNAYLLKPIVKEDLKDALDDISKKLLTLKNEELAYRSLINLSIDSKAHIAKKFLQALVNESTVEIKTLYPLVYRMKISFMEGEGAVLILAPNEEALIDSGLPASDISIYRYILNQAATEIVEKGHSGQTFLDSDENTCILVSGDEAETVKKSCADIIATVNSFMLENTPLSVTACLGTPISDILQLSQSYKSARLLLTCSLIPEKRHLYTYGDRRINAELKQADEVIGAIRLLKSGFIEGNEMNYGPALAKLSELINCSSMRSVLRCGVYIIRSIAALKTDCSAENAEGAMKMLQSFSKNNDRELSKNAVVKLYRGIIGHLSGSYSDDEVAGRSKSPFDDENIIDQAKDYIYLHYQEPVSLALIAENIGISSSYLSQLFHKTAGESYIQFLTRVRMEQAAKLLRAYPGEKISNICEKVGYMGVKHFTYVFKQYYNVTPGEYQSGNRT